jgi:hypothetical protein
MRQVNQRITAYDRKYEIKSGHSKKSVIHLQTGSVTSVGANGCQVEDLLTVAIDRLETFQDGPVPCRENAAALRSLKAALKQLEKRTARRSEQGVEGRMIAHK